MIINQDELRRYINKSRICLIGCEAGDEPELDKFLTDNYSGMYKIREYQTFKGGLRTYIRDNTIDSLVKGIPPLDKFIIDLSRLNKPIDLSKLSGSKSTVNTRSTNSMILEDWNIAQYIQKIVHEGNLSVILKVHLYPRIYPPSPTVMVYSGGSALLYISDITCAYMGKNKIKIDKNRYT